MSKWMEDRWQLAIGVVVELISYSWLLGLMGNASADTPWVLWRFIVGAAVNVFGVPIIFVTTTSLYSKFLPAHIQGFGQGVRRSVFSIAYIMGPLWSGGTVGLGSYYLLLAVPCGLMASVLVLMLLSFTRLKAPKSKPKD